MAQPHILSHVCALYVAHKCEAGLESVHTSDRKPSVAQPHILSQASLSPLYVHVAYKCDLEREAGPLEGFLLVVGTGSRPASHGTYGRQIVRLGH